jgi:hypothetical protein
MDPMDPEPPGGDTRRRDRLLVWTATGGSLVCAVLIFLATNTFDAGLAAGVAEPVASPTQDTATPLAASSSITTTTEPTTTTTVPTTTTTTTTTRPRTTTTRPTTTTHATTTTTTQRTTTTTRRCVVADWQWNTAYNRGSVVAYQGHLWYATEWNYNAVPGNNGQNAWQLGRSC